ncbi:MAG: T9SS type A sorting domain-containing protein [Bacteroidales bacterium]|nr:T9SS type A sorting domain-containing protein [Bacteroidales bacterium]
MPDVRVEFNEDSYLEIFGHFSAIGEYNKEVKIFGNGTSRGVIQIYGYLDNPLDSILFEYCWIWDGYALDSLAGGGGLSIIGRDRVSLKNCIMEGNKAKNKGGAIYLENSDILISNTEFYYNVVGNDADDAKGGALYAKNCDPQIVNSYFKGSHAQIGGAIFTSNSSPELIGCSFEDSYCFGGGGGIVFQDSGHVLIMDCSFKSNSATGSGGALAFLEGIHARIENTYFENNHAESSKYIADGGAIFITPFDNEINIINCIFKGNVSEHNGGAVHVESDANIIGSLFIDNNTTTADMQGGGAIAASQAHLIIHNCTFSNNYSPLVGTSLLLIDANISMINSILWDDVVYNQNVIFLNTIEDTAKLFIDNCDIKGGINYINATGGVLNWENGNIEESPHFILPGVDFSLAWNSPCINAGRSDTLQFFIPAEDLAGNPRISGGEIDMGCYEYQGPIRIPEKVKNEDFVVYPNPAKDHIYIRSGREFDGRLTISDLSGRTVVDREVNISKDSQIRQALPGIPAGFYILNLNSKDYSLSQKLIIK